ncbi:MAG: hypothetical protein IT361_10265 [Gemmatimonadaceae bacterium]|nr:hypothetical protein [Gemmatimonadaceae bacterium]
MTQARRALIPWLWLSVGLLRAVLGTAVPVAEARQAARAVTTESVAAHIEETSRPECTPPTHEDCALCAYLGLAVEVSDLASIAADDAGIAQRPAGAVALGSRAVEALPHPRGPPVVS